MITRKHLDESQGPCPRCRRATGVEEDDSTGSSRRWFVCRLCGRRWSLAPKTFSCAASLSQPLTSRRSVTSPKCSRRGRRRGRPNGARVVQLRGELVPGAHFETLRDEPEVLRERLEGARLVPELELVDFVGMPIARLRVLDDDLEPGLKFRS